MPLNSDVRSFYLKETPNQKPCADVAGYGFDIDKKGKSYKIGRIFIQDLHSFDHSKSQARNEMEGFLLGYFFNATEINVNDQPTSTNRKEN